MLPRGRAAWAAYAVVMIILSASSIAPFISFERDGPRLGLSDAADALTYVVTWVPFIALLVGYSRTSITATRAWVAWAGHAVLLFVLPATHTLTFFAATTLIRGDSAAIPPFGSVPFQVLTLLGTLQYLVIVAVALAAASGRAMEDERVRATELALSRATLEAQLTRARVGALRAQLQPHFLFNTLNSISVLTSADPAGARTMIRRLSEMLRAVLSDADRPTVPLRREIELLEAYLAIQVVRFGDRLRVRVDVDPAALDRMVPTLVLQPLVENSIQYAVAEREEGGSVVVSAQFVDDRLILSVVDDGPGFTETSGGTSALDNGRGVGHRNTRERLREMYGPAHTFVVEPAPGAGCAVRLELPA